ncbi:hypothetical protein OnM2_050071, partial [Erysiphe neolycopersici]
HLNNPLADHCLLDPSPQTLDSNKQVQGLLDTNYVNENFSNTPSQSRKKPQNNNTSLSPVENETIPENIPISGTLPSSQFKNKTAKLMAERALRKEQKLDAQKAWKLAHRAEGVLKGHRRSDLNIGRALTSKLSRNNENLKMVMKAEAYFHIPKTYKEVINSPDKNDWLKAINDEINSLKN